MDLYNMSGSPSTRAVMMTAKAVGVEFNSIQVNTFVGEQLEPWFVKINPQHTIPTLVDNLFVIWETRAIVVYLVEQYGKDDSLYPKDPQKQALINQRLYFDMGTLYDGIAKYFFPLLRTANPELRRILRNWTLPSIFSTTSWMARITWPAISFQWQISLYWPPFPQPKWLTSI